MNCNNRCKAFICATEMCRGTVCEACSFKGDCGFCDNTACEKCGTVEYIADPVTDLSESEIDEGGT